MCIHLQSPLLILVGEVDDVRETTTVLQDFNLFHADVPFLYPLKTSENQRSKLKTLWSFIYFL